MNIDLLKAKSVMENNNHTCVLCKGDEIYTSDSRGVKPLLDFFDCKANFTSFSAADKIVGKGAAFIYVLLKVESVYAKVISRPAKEILENGGINVQFDELVDAIRNRDNTGFCPIETAVMDVPDAETALPVIRKKLSELIA